MMMRDALLRTGIASASCALLVPQRARAYEQKPPASRVILIRHGESEGNVNFDIYRSTPDARIHLTKKGWTQAHEAGRLLGAMLGDSARVRVVCSPYVRTRETLSGVTAGWDRLRHAPTAIEPRVAEMDVAGGLTMEDATFRHANVQSRSNPYFFRWPNGESWADLERRTLDYCKADGLLGPCASAAPAAHEAETPETVVIVTHALAAMTLMRSLCGASPDIEDVCMRRCLKNCELVELVRGEKGLRLVRRIVPSHDGSAPRDTRISPQDEWYEHFPLRLPCEDAPTLRQIARTSPPSP